MTKNKRIKDLEGYTKDLERRIETLEHSAKHAEWKRLSVEDQERVKEHGEAIKSHVMGHEARELSREASKYQTERLGRDLEALTTRSDANIDNLSERVKELEQNIRGLNSFNLDFRHQLKNTAKEQKWAVHKFHLGCFGPDIMSDEEKEKKSNLLVEKEEHEWGRLFAHCRGHAKSVLGCADCATIDSLVLVWKYWRG